MEVFRTLAKAEARKISEVISKQFVNRWLDRLYPGKPRLVYWAMDAEDEQGKMAHVEKIAKMAAVGYRAEDDEVSELIGMRVSYREPEVPGMPGGMMPGVGGVIRNREGAGSMNEPYDLDTERLLTELDEDAIKRRAEFYAKKLESAAVNGLGLAVDEMTAQTAAEEGDEPETDNESQNGRHPVATPLQNAGNGQDEDGDGEPVMNMSRSEAARHAAMVRWGEGRIGRNRGNGREGETKSGKSNTPLRAGKKAKTKEKVEVVEKAIKKTAKKGGSVKTGVKSGKKELVVNGGHPDYYGSSHAARHFNSSEISPRKVANTIVNGKISKDGDSIIARGKNGSKVVLFDDGKGHLKLTTAYKDPRP